VPETLFKRAAAAHTVVGDFGALSGTFVFGLMVVYAVQAPFVVAAFLAVIAAFYCLAKMPVWK
jgi:hypothetical protein